MLRTIALFLGTILFLAGLMAGYIYYVFEIRSKTEPKARTNQTSTKAVIHKSARRQMNRLWIYTELYKYLKDNEDKIENQFYPIPGLRESKTIDSKSGQISMCTSMTPQGIAVTDKYIFVSAYCKTHTHHSMIYVINKKSHKFIKEIILPGRPHVGGMAYDRVNQNLWVTCSDNGIAAVAAIALDDIMAYDLDEEQKPIGYLYKYPLYTITRSSFMTYYGNKLYVGYFTTKGDSTIQSFLLDERGAIVQTKSKDYENLVKDAMISEVVDEADISKHVQGMALSGSRLLLAQSYGLYNSKITVYDNTNGNSNFTEAQAINKIILPRQLEQICIDGGDLYMIYESAAYAYRAIPLPTVDYIIKINLYDTLKIDKKDLDIVGD